MARAPKPRSVREAYTDSNKWDRFYALMGGEEPKNQIAVKDKRVVTNRSEPGELEAAVMREVADVIILSSNVLLAWRQNSGSIQDMRGVPVSFYKWVKWTEEMTLVDYLCMLRSGKFAALECKRKGWKYTGTPREKKQDAFIQAARGAGGRGGFVTCGEDALEILGG